MATINIGSLSFTHKGDYASGTAYVKNDVVYYSTNGNAYIAKQATTGNAPTNATYWSQFAQGSGGIWDGGLSLGSASQSLRVNSGGNALEFYTPTSGGLIKSVGATKVNTQTINFNNGRTVVSGLNLDFGAVVGSSNKLLIMGCLEYGYSGGDPSPSIRWEYSADNSTWYGDKNLSTQQSGSGHAGTDANANWSGGIFFGGTGVTIPTASVIHSATNQIIAVSALTVVPRYFRVTVRQCDNSNDSLYINYHDNTGGYAATGNSTFNVMELAV